MASADNISFVKQPCLLSHTAASKKTAGCEAREKLFIDCFLIRAGSCEMSGKVT